MGTPGVFKLNIALPSGGEVTLECDDRELVRELLYSALPQLSHIASPPPAAERPAPAAAEPPPARHSNGNGKDAVNGNGNGAFHSPMPPAPAPEYAAGAPYPSSAYPPAFQSPATNGRETVPGSAHTPAPAPTPAYHPPPGPFAEALAPAMPFPPTPESVGVGIGISAPNGHSHGHGYPANGNGNSPHAHAYNGNPTQDPPVPDAAPTPTPAVEPATLDENDYVAFCHQVSPLGDMRRVVVAAEAADRYLGIASVDPDELTRLFRLAGWSLPHNFVQTLRNAARSKFRWLERIAGQSGHYRVTDTGRSIVLGDSKGAAGMTAPMSAPVPTATVPSDALTTLTPAGAGIGG